LEILENAINAWYRERLEEANNAIDLAEKLTEVCGELMEEILKYEGTTAISLAYIVESIRRTGFYATDISETAINHIITLTEREGEGAERGV
jgi:hypothetical protein